MKRTDLIQLDQYYDQPPASVWRAMTEPELLARWWAAGDVRPVVGPPPGCRRRARGRS